ncbi:MAG: UPF0758 domain-containing protein, partial [Xanthomonadales bacterium]|nr:UPF0758 domain-containing protein [Xanthomonadales bacterium]
MPINQWPEGERPREKLLLKGAHHLSDAELLAIFLRTGTRGKSAVDLARELIQRHGGLRPLLEAGRKDFCHDKGIGPSKYALVLAALELGKRYLAATLDREDQITGPESTRDYLRLRMRGFKHEVFAVLFMDNRHRVIEFKEMFRGTINGASVYPR